MMTAAAAKASSPFPSIARGSSFVCFATAKPVSKTRYRVVVGGTYPGPEEGGDIGVIVPVVVAGSAVIDPDDVGVVVEVVGVVVVVVVVVGMTVTVLGSEL